MTKVLLPGLAGAFFLMLAALFRANILGSIIVENVRVSICALPIGREIKIIVIEGQSH
jgi:hypothetical protein